MKKKIIGKRITDLRVKKGVSTCLLAQQIGKSQATISRIENGKQNITLLLLAEISKALRVHPLFILSGKNCFQNNNNTGAGCFEKIMHESRLKSQMSIKSVAITINRSPRYIEDIENGLILPTDKEVEVLSKRFNLNILLLKELYYAEIYCPNFSKKVLKISNDLIKYSNIKSESDHNSNDLNNNSTKKLNLLEILALDDN